VVEARTDHRQMMGTQVEPHRVDATIIPLGNSADEAEAITDGFRAYMIRTAERDSGSSDAGGLTVDIEHPKAIRALACLPSAFRS
jgi:hypothetical protein